MSTLITEEYRDLNTKLHEENSKYGMSGARWASDIMSLCQSFNTRDVLDYGCGKSTLAQNLPFKIKQYDPAIYKYNTTPMPADIVVCTDVLEHIEPMCIDNVLDNLKCLIQKAGFFNISLREAKKKLPDGRNAHLLVKDYRWWLNKLLPRVDLVSLQCANNELIVVVRPIMS